MEKNKKNFCENDACWKKFSFFNEKLRRKSFVKKKFSIEREIHSSAENIILKL